MGAGASRVADGVAGGVMAALVLAGTSGLGYGVARASSQGAPEAGPATQVAAAPTVTPTPAATPTATPTATTASPSASSTATPSATPTASPSARPVERPVASTAPLPRARPSQVPLPGPRLLGPGDAGASVKDLQARLRQIAWFTGDVSEQYAATTTAAVRGFQARRGIAVTGDVDQRTLDRLHAMTRTPTGDELANRLPGGATTSAPLDPRCTTGRALCVDKSTRTVRWVVDGSVRRTLDVRFGAAYSPTREGLFHVGWTSRDHVSKLYGSSMPFAMFFSGGQAVHYSSDFAARGYAGASHGCVNVRDLAGVAWLFDQVEVGDKVVIYWS